MHTAKRPVVIERYVPSVDWWVIAVVGIIVLVLLAAIPILIASSAGAASKVVGALSLMAFILYLIDLTFFCSYFLMPDALTIVSQLRRHRFPYDSMVSVEPGNMLGLISVPGKKRFALSSNCLIIALSEGEWKKITVSPKARDRFLESLMGHAGGLRRGTKK